MVTAKLAFALVQVGTNLWINPMQLQGISTSDGSECKTIILVASRDITQCSDWPIEKVRMALAPIAVSRAMGDK